MLPFSFIGTGTYTNPATLVTQNVPLSDIPDWFFVKDITNWGAQTTAAAPVYSEWYSSMASGSFLAMNQPSSTGAGVTLYASQGTAGGFTFINNYSPPTFAALPATGINKTTFVVTMANTGTIAVGDTVRVNNAVGMQQISNYTFTVTAVTTNTSITLGMMATAAAAPGFPTFANNATSANITKVIPNKWYPKNLRVAYITQASQAVVYFAEANTYTPGEIVDFNIPTPYGMIPLSALTSAPGGAPTVLSVVNSATQSSITINVNTSGFPAFTWPTTTSIFSGASPAVCIPAGSGIVPLNGSLTPPQSPPGTNLLDAFDNRNQYLMQIGTSACGIASATMQWMAFKADYNGLSNA